MTADEASTWKCSQCHKPVPEQCDGKCATGTTAEKTDSK
jgi:hypothetical protein